MNLYQWFLSLNAIHYKIETKRFPIKLTSFYDKAITEWCQSFYPEQLASAVRVFTQNN